MYIDTLVRLTGAEGAVLLLSNPLKNANKMTPLVICFERHEYAVFERSMPTPLAVEIRTPSPHLSLLCTIVTVQLFYDYRQPVS